VKTPRACCIEAIRIAFALADMVEHESLDPYEGGFYPGLDDLIDQARELKKCIEEWRPNDPKDRSGA